MFRYSPVTRTEPQFSRPDVVESPKCFVLGRVIIIVTKQFADNQCVAPDGTLFVLSTPAAVIVLVCVCVCVSAP